MQQEDYNIPSQYLNNLESDHHIPNIVIQDREYGYLNSKPKKGLNKKILIILALLALVIFIAICAIVLGLIPLYLCNYTFLFNIFNSLNNINVLKS